jgi:CubicO group peptidase (beta-lactamase class C family)
LVFLLISGATFADNQLPPVAKLEKYLKKAVENGYSGSVLVGVNTRVVLQNGYGWADRENNVKFTADTVFDIGSITKQFTAACILKLEMDGKLSVQDPMSKYLENVPEDKKAITLHHLLTHSSGFVDSLGSDEEMVQKDAYLKRAFAAPLRQPPGTFDYSNVGYSLLAAVIEKVTGKDYERYLLDAILLPAGMRFTGYALPDWTRSTMAIGYRNKERWGTTYEMSRYDQGVTWHLKGNGGIHSTVGDMHKWYLALQEDSILSKKAKDKYFAPHVREGEGPEFYAYGWSVWENDEKQKVIAHNGGNGFFMATMGMIPQQGFVVIVSTNDAVKNTDTIASRIRRILFEDIEELSESFIQRYTGQYTLPSGVPFSVRFNENDSAVLSLNEAETHKLFSGSIEDDEKRTQHFDQKTNEFFQALWENNPAKAASTVGLPAEEAENMSGFRERIEKEGGNCKDFKVEGSVSRRGGGFHLTLVNFNCDKRISRLVIWQGEDLMDLRPLPEGNIKEFEYVGGKEFHSESNNRTIHFDLQKDTPVLKMKIGTGEIIARKK